MQKEIYRDNRGLSFFFLLFWLLVVHKSSYKRLELMLTCLVFDNWRVLHGRSAFTGHRRMCGAYGKCISFFFFCFLLPLSSS